jgi:uncharacterized phage-associated protein
MIPAESAARYLLLLARETEEERTPVTHMQLQKLLYYAQGWSLASKGRRLFRGRLEAWRHGPVVREAFSCFKDFKSDPIPPEEARDEGGLLPEDRALLQSIWLRYGRYAGWQLREMTHSEPPWRNARGDLPDQAKSDAEISDDQLAEYFGKLYESDCRRVGIDPAALAGADDDLRAGRVVPLAEAFGVPRELGR